MEQPPDPDLDPTACVGWALPRGTEGWPQGVPGVWGAEGWNGVLRECGLQGCAWPGLHWLAWGCLGPSEATTLASALVYGPSLSNIMDEDLFSHPFSYYRWGN